MQLRFFFKRPGLGSTSTPRTESPSWTSTATTSRPASQPRSPYTGLKLHFDIRHLDTLLQKHLIFQVNITRLQKPYTSDCYPDWASTGYDAYVPTVEDGTYKAGWAGYNLPVKHATLTVK